MSTQRRMFAAPISPYACSESELDGKRKLLRGGIDPTPATSPQLEAAAGKDRVC